MLTFFKTGERQIKYYNYIKYNTKILYDKNEVAKTTKTCEDEANTASKIF